MAGAAAGTARKKENGFRYSRREESWDVTGLPEVNTGPKNPGSECDTMTPRTRDYLMITASPCFFAWYKRSLCQNSSGQERDEF